jgi:HSP20 family protein
MKRKKPFDEFEEIFNRFIDEFDEYIREFELENWGEVKAELYQKPLWPERRKKIKISDGKSRTLIDVFEIGDEIHVIVDLNGTKQDEVELYPSERQLEIRTINELNLYEKIELPAKVDVKSMKQSFKNGVLEVSLKRKTA